MVRSPGMLYLSKLERFLGIVLTLALVLTLPVMPLKAGEAKAATVPISAASVFPNVDDRGDSRKVVEPSGISAESSLELGAATGNRVTGLPSVPVKDAEIGHLDAGDVGMYAIRGFERVLAREFLSARSSKSLPDGGEGCGFMIALAAFAIAVTLAFIIVLRQDFRQRRLPEACGCRSP